MRRVLLPLILFVALYIVFLGHRPLAVMDEARYGEISREMVETGDWVVPRLVGLRYFEKPVMGYWLNAISLRFLGENAFAVRFSSALGAGLTALMLFFLARKGFGKAQIGVFAACIFLTFLMVVVVARTAILDMPVSTFLTLAIGFFYFAYGESSRGRRMLYLVLFGLFCGCAFLTKGFLAFAVPGVTIAGFLLWERNWKAMFTMPWIPLLVAVLVSLPWALAIHAREPDYWHYFFWVEHVQRFAAENAQHKNPFWYFIPVGLVLALPWTGLLPAGIQGVKKAYPEHRTFIRFAICWTALPFLFFSVCSGKLATYILPCYSPLALLLSLGLTRSLQDDDRKVLHRGIGGTALFLLVGLIGILVFQLGLPEKGVPFQKVEVRNWVLFCSGLLCAIGLFGASIRQARPVGKMILFMVALVPVYMSVPLVLSNNVRAAIPAKSFYDSWKDQVPEGSLLLSDGSVAPSVAWYFQRSDVVLTRFKGELEYGLNYPDASDKYLELDALQRFIKAHAGKETITLVLWANRYETFREHLPKPSFEAADLRTSPRRRLVMVQYH